MFVLVVVYYLPFKVIKDGVVDDGEFGRVIFCRLGHGGMLLRGAWNSAQQKYKDLTTLTKERTRRQFLPHVV